MMELLVLVTDGKSFNNLVLTGDSLKDCLGHFYEIQKRSGTRCNYIKEVLSCTTED